VDGQEQGIAEHGAQDQRLADRKFTKKSDRDVLVGLADDSVRQPQYAAPKLSQVRVPGVLDLRNSRARSLPKARQIVEGSAGHIGSPFAARGARARSDCQNPPSKEK
jgi:hypothetical protein